jgi:hypothetical protein
MYSREILGFSTRAYFQYYQPMISESDSTIIHLAHAVAFEAEKLTNKRFFRNADKLADALGEFSAAAAEAIRLTNEPRMPRFG